MDAVARQRIMTALRAMRVERFDEPRWTTEEVRDHGDEAVLVGRFELDRHLYGIPIDVTERSHEFYYTDIPVADDDEWLESVDLGLMVMLDTGFRAGARRRLVDDYIELREEGGWPVDDRFHLQEGGDQSELLAERLREVGLDPDLAAERRAQGRLLHWLLAYENNASGGHWVGHALVIAGTTQSPILEQVETRSGVPSPVRLDLAYFACHAAAERGAHAITTTLIAPELTLAGFKPTSNGASVLDTSFLDADPDGARALLEADLTRGEAWGRDRDVAGRHLPPSRLGRLLHRLRRGRSGRRPRTYAAFQPAERAHRRGAGGVG